MIVALLPAAGHSRRMGRPKLTLPLGNGTVIEQVIATLRQAGIERILVVAGPHLPELVSLAEEAGASVLLLKEPTPDMRQTIEAGLACIESTWHPADDDAFLLVPADHPTLDSEIVRKLVSRDAEALRSGASAGDALRSEDSASRLTKIAIPTYNGKRGHPTLIGWSHVAGIRSLPSDRGLNAYLRAHPESVREVAVDTDSILLDLDTPEDYQRLLEAEAQRGDDSITS